MRFAWENANFSLFLRRNADQVKRLPMFVSDLQLAFLAWLELAISILERFTSYERGAHVSGGGYAFGAPYARQSLRMSGLDNGSARRAYRHL